MGLCLNLGQISRCVPDESFREYLDCERARIGYTTKSRQMSDIHVQERWNYCYSARCRVMTPEDECFDAMKVSTSFDTRDPLSLTYQIEYPDNHCSK